MNKSGMIIRLIDVVLILLLGFTRISQFVLRSQIKLPSTEKQLETTEEEDKETYTVQINSRVVKRGDETITIVKFRVLEGDETKVIESVAELEQVILAKYEECKKANRDMLLLIEPYPESIVQTTVDVLDICERYGIPKSIKPQVTWTATTQSGS